MNKIEILTPIHIGSGEDYYSFTIVDNKRYQFEEMLLAVDNPENYLNNNLLNSLSNPNIASRLSNKRFFEIFAIQKDQIKKLKEIYNVNYNYMQPGKVYANTKTMNNLIIPGSTIKGYLANMIWFDIIEKEDRIKNYIISKGLHLKRKNFLRYIRLNVEKVNQLLGCRDIIFNNTNPYIYYCSRLGTSRLNRRNEIPVGNIECINPGEIFQGEVLFETNYNSESIIKSHKLNIDKDSHLKPSDKIVEKAFLTEIYKRINNFKPWLLAANRRFNQLTIEAIEKYLMQVDNQNIDKESISVFYDDLKANIKAGDIIIRLGKFTNYIEKSIGIAFGKEYNKYFKDLFTPNWKNKQQPGISTMNILRDAKGLYSIVPGYLRFSFGD